MATATHYSIKQLEDLWVHAGGDPKKKRLMAAIAMAESRGDPGAVNPKSGATGLWQIHPGGARYRDPLANARAAVGKLHRQGLGAWEAYTNGSYRKFLGGGGGGVMHALGTAASYAEAVAIGAGPHGDLGNPISVASRSSKAAGDPISGYITGAEDWLKKEAVVSLSYLLLTAAALAFFVLGAMRATGTSPGAVVRPPREPAGVGGEIPF